MDLKNIRALLTHPDDSAMAYSEGYFGVSVGETLTFTISPSDDIWISSSRPICWETGDRPLDECARAKAFRDAFRNALGQEKRKRRLARESTIASAKR